jgi:hypothetical protein
MNRWLRRKRIDAINALASHIVDESLALNRTVDGGWVTITAHPIFGHGRWVVRVEAADGRWRPVVIGTQHQLSDAVKEAWAWIDEHAGDDGRVSRDTMEAVFAMEAHRRRGRSTWR